MTFVTAQGLCFYILFAPVWAVYVPQSRQSGTPNEFVILTLKRSVSGYQLLFVLKAFRLTLNSFV